MYLCGDGMPPAGQITPLTTIHTKMMRMPNIYLISNSLNVLNYFALI